MSRQDGTSPAPAWWFGAPLLGLMLGMTANWFFPHLVPQLVTALVQVFGGGEPDPISPYRAKMVASLVGIVLAVGLLSVVGVSRRFIGERRRDA